MEWEVLQQSENRKMQLMLNRLLQMKNRSQLQLTGERDWDILQLIVCRHLFLRGLLQHWDWGHLQISRNSGEGEQL